MNVIILVVDFASSSSSSICYRI